VTRAEESRIHGVDAWYSLGLRTGTDNVVNDVLMNSPAFQAGLGPGMKLVAVNGRGASDDLLRAAINETKTGSRTIDLIVENTGFFRMVKVEYQGGAKYPHLTPDGSRAALIDEILKPMANHPDV